MQESDQCAAYEAAKARMILNNPVYYPNRAVFFNELSVRLPAEIDRLPKKGITLYRGKGRIAAELYYATLIAIRMSDENGAKDNERSYKPGPAECFTIATEVVGDLHHIHSDVVLTKAAAFFELGKKELIQTLPEAACEDIMEQYTVTTGGK